MPSFNVVWVDAFTDVPLEGNSCAVVLDARGLDDARMQAIARETNLSETSFVFPGDAECDFRVRYFTPASEVPMAGHPTVATAHALRESGLIAGDLVRLRMPAGVVPVTIRRGSPPEYAMSQPAPEFLTVHPHSAITKALGLAESDILTGFEPETVSTGTPQLMVPLASRDALDRCIPDRALFPAQRDYFSVHAFARGAGEATLVSRHFADFGRIIEDPFTGSATGGMAAYCARYGIVREREFTVAQGMHVKRPGHGRVEVTGNPPHDIGRITVAGPAVTVMAAVLTLP